MTVKFSQERKVRSFAKKTFGSTRVGRAMRLPFEGGVLVGGVKGGEGVLIGGVKGGRYVSWWCEGGRVSGIGEGAVGRAGGDWTYRVQSGGVVEKT